MFEATVRLLFSAATDRTVAVWSERGQQLQVRPPGSAARRPAPGHSRQPACPRMHASPEALSPGTETQIITPVPPGRAS